ncbi:MAG: high-potential iron-sulfur protein [Rubrivivax sp.]|jgi:hypothetical protein|nr:high-potential iron-sulfur protein [Rubrivivax sp.]
MTSRDPQANARPRRVFLMAAAGSAFAPIAFAQAPARLDENDPLAKAQGYVHDAAKVDRAKWPKFQPGQNCATCQLYQAKASDPWGGCPLFGTRQVAAKGWCNAWIKKA